MPTPRVLVVDDEKFIRDLLQEFLDKQGYDVVLSESGETAVELTESTSVDVALVDLKMPGIDGLETLNRLKNNQPNIPVIIMTGYPTIETSIKALRLGAYDYVVKPFKLNELKAAVENALKESKLMVEISALRSKIKTIEGELQQYESEDSQIPDSPQTTKKKSVKTAEKIVLSTGSSDLISQIKQLGELKEKGILTEKEFEIKKAELLSRL
ncbi:MAG: response regulator [candidate division Zixibacteria bacterium]|nr:response regulator [candidate division Zixibacteria bacterium]